MPSCLRLEFGVCFYGYSSIWLIPEKTALLLGIRGSLAHGFEIATRLGDVPMRMHSDKQNEAKLSPLISREENCTISDM